MMELLLDLDDLSLDIDGDEKERRMASLNPSRHRIKQFFNVPDKDDDDDGSDVDDGKDNGDGDSDEEEDMNMATLTITQCCWYVRSASQ